jgi:GT2 family glycosyltransferase
MSAGSSGPLAAAIVHHDDWPATIRQLDAWGTDPDAHGAFVAWHVIDNSPRRESGDAPYGSSFRLSDLPIASELGESGRRLAERVTVHRSENRGYGSALNEVARLARTDYLLGLNADLLPEPGFIAAVRTLIEGDRARGTAPVIRGARLLNADGSAQGTAGPFPTLASTLLGLLRPRARRKYLSLANEPAEVPWVTGACILLDRARFERLGMFADEYFMYYEDVDFCRRAATLGERVVFEPSLVARHLQPYHSRPLTIRMVYMARHGLLRWFLRHRPAGEFRMLGRVMRAECLWRGRRNGWEAVDRMVAEFVADPAGYRLDPARIPEPTAAERTRIERWLAGRTTALSEA